MYKCKMSAYEGEKPYIFVSYAHRDSEIVLPIIDTLAEEGYRIWYDDGIAPGSEWPEYIASHLNGCAVTMAFISPNSIASPNCRREVTFALSKNKLFLGVILEPTEMSVGMEMQLSAQQCVMRYNFRNPDTGEIDEKRFAEKLATASELAECRELSHEQIQEAIEAERAAAAEAAEKLARLKQAEEERIAAQKAIRELEERQKAQAAAEKAAAERAAAEKAEKAAAENAAAEKKTAGNSAAGKKSAGNAAQGNAAARTAPGKNDDPGKKGGRGKKIGKIIGIVAALLVVAEIGLYALFGGGGKSVGGGKEIQLAENTVARKDSTSIHFRDEKITADTVAALGELSDLASVIFENCSFEGVSLEGAAFLEKLALFRISGGDQVPDLSPLTGCSSLRTLEVMDCGVTNLDFLPEGVREINISRTKITDISRIAACKELTSVSMNGCDQVTDFAPLLECEKLSALSAADCGIKDFTGSFKNLEFKSICLSGNQIEDASFLNNLTRLEELDMSGNPITSLDCAAKSAGTLKRLNVGWTGLDISFLNGITDCTALEYLNINGIPMMRLDFTSKMDELVEIHAEDCGLDSADALSSKTALEFVYLRNNEIINSKIFNLESEQDYYIDLSNNAIAGFNFPKKMKALLLPGNVKFYNAIPDDVVIEYLVVDYNDYLVNEKQRSAAFLDRDKIGNIIILDAPEDQIMNLKDVFSVYVDFVTTEQFEATYAREGTMKNIWDWKFE